MNSSVSLQLPQDIGSTGINPNDGVQFGSIVKSSSLTGSSSSSASNTGFRPQPEKVQPDGTMYITQDTFNRLAKAMQAEWTPNVHKMVEGTVIMFNRSLSNYSGFGTKVVSQLQAPSQVDVMGWPGVNSSTTKEQTISIIAKNAGLSYEKASDLYQNYKAALVKHYASAVRAVGATGGWRAAGDGVNNVKGPETVSNETVAKQPKRIIVLNADGTAPNQQPQAAAPSSVSSNLFAKASTNNLTVADESDAGSSSKSLKPSTTLIASSSTTSAIFTSAPGRADQLLKTANDMKLEAPFQARLDQAAAKLPAVYSLMSPDQQKRAGTLLDQISAEAGGAKNPAKLNSLITAFNMAIWPTQAKL